MPYELHIPVHRNQVSELDLAQQRGMHGLFFAALEQTVPDVAQEMHSNPTKPFTQALIQERKQGPVTWRVTLLADDLYAPFVEGLARLPEIHLLGEPLTVAANQIQCRHQSYPALAAAAPCFRFQTDFLTPTAFSQRVFDHPIPDPYLCFQSWWVRWHQFSPLAEGINIAVLDVVRGHLAVSQFRLSSRFWRDGKRGFVGGVGQMRFIARQKHKVAEEWWCHMATLANFARYCGTGHKTTQGMGQTQVDGPRS